MISKVDLYEDGLEEYPQSGVVVGNAAMILWFVLGAIACWFFNPWIGLIYLIAAFIIVYIIFKKIVCTNCYYYGKRCHLGWGILSSKMFNKGDIKLFQTSIGLKVAAPTYGLLMIVPILLILISMYQDFDYYKVIVLVLLIIVTGYSAGAERKKACGNCKMRKICPGSAVK
ncbi:MAG: hypothetical protein JSV49_07660 [Thermoplasmata archaeon]|nr:MAG: hypothetical protein JSV49_07660 [Thermoplasmata archaeon]